MPKRRASTHPRSTAHDPVVVTAAGPEDLLRFVPDLLPIDPVDSMVLILFRHSTGTRSRTHGAMRVDLRHTDEPDELQAWSEAVLGQVLRVEGVTGVAFVAYTQETFAPGGRPPAAAQVRAMARQADAMGLEVLDRFVVAADAWGSLGDPELPRGGRPLSLIEPERRRPRRPGFEEEQQAPRRRQERFRRDFTDWWDRADGPGGVLHGVHLAQQGGSFGPAAEGEPAMERFRFGRDVDGVVDLLEGVLEPHDAEGERPCACRSLLFALVQRQGLLGLVLAQIAWGPGFGREVWTAVCAPAGRQRSLDRMIDALGGGRFRRPDVDRIERAIAALHETATYVPEASLRGPIDEAQAWLHWACGAGSAAGSYAARAVDRCEDRDIAPIVLGKVRRGELPRWAFRRDAGRPDRFEALPEARSA